MDRNQQRQDSVQGRQGHDQSPSAPFQSMAEVALRGTALLWDLQMETARNLWRTQARTAAMLGVPDCSDLFEIGDARARRLFSMGAEQVLNTARQAREAVSEMQRQFGRIAENQTIGITEDVREQIAQISRHTEQGLQEIRDMAVSQAMEPDAGEWEPRFDAARAGANGADDSAEESGSAMEAGASHEERAPREARSRARR